MKKRSACMIAYAEYFTDARIKNYVDALLKAGYQVDVFALGQPEPTRPGLHVYCLMPKVVSKKPLPYILSQLWFLVLVAFRAGLAAIREHYVLVHVHNMPDFIVFASLIPRLMGARVILDIHDPMPEAYATKFDLDLNHPLIRLIRFEERLSAAFAHHVITVHDLAKEVLVEDGIPDPKISIIMNVGNEAIFRPVDRERSGEGLTLAYHGTITERLGINLILEAVHQVHSLCPGLRFILIGDGEFMPAVRQLISDYALENTVQLRGWVPVDDLSLYLKDADAGIIGNRGYTENKKNWMLPVKMLEYTAMEIPTIAPRLRTIGHYFDEKSAFFYAPDDVADMARRITELYQNPEKIAQVRQFLKTFNQKYNWSQMEKRYLDIVTHLIEKKAVPVDSQ